MSRYCVHNILLSGTCYDLYVLSQSGFRVSGQGHRELCDHVGINLAQSVTEAVDQVSTNNYQLVITDHVGGRIDGYKLGEAIHNIHPGIPVFLLTSDTRLGGPDPTHSLPNTVDRVFIWTGNPLLASSMVQLLEDEKNAEQDILERGLRWILLVEDEPNFYSRYIPMIHQEMRRRIQQLVSDNDLISKSRCLTLTPRLLLATSLGQAAGLLQRYHHRLLGVISDVCFPIGGQLDPDAGFRLVSLIRTLPWDLPVILQSMEMDAEARARNEGVGFVSKMSPLLLSTLRQHLLDYFGFGDFIFKLPNGQEVARASTIEGLRRCIAEAPLESVVYHARRHHFSNWLAIHGKVDLAERIRPIDGPDEELRRLALAHIREDPPSTSSQ